VKILHLITSFAVGGAQDNTLLTVEKHDRSRFDVHLASNPDGQWIDRACRAADTFHPLSNLVRPLNPARDSKALLDIIRLLFQERFDIVHTHSSKAGILGRWAAQIAKVPVVVHTIHGFPFHDFMPAWQRQLYINLERSARPCSNFIITLSELDRQEAAKLNILGMKNSRAVYTGIDFSKLDRPYNPQQTRQHLGIPEGWQTIVMVGRLDPQKAPYLLIEAFAKVVKQHPETLLMLVGDGELRPSLQTQAQELDIADKVKFLGTREDVPEILKVADIFSFSSLWEAMGRAMIEATLVGKPVVVPSTGGIPEIVHQNETGLLFPVGDIEQLAAHLIFLLQHPEERCRIGQNAKQLTRRLFDADYMVRQIEQIYDLLLNKKNSILSS
jgi:glycosyltransferase involved in cell wall biosynthesis